MKRLYLRGRDSRHDLYHDTVDRLMLDSEILNGGSKVPNVYMTFWTKKNIEVAIYQMLGEADGYFHDHNGEKQQAAIPSVKEKIHNLKTAWESTCSKAVQEGKPKPAKMDVKLFNAKLVHEAELTVLEEELAVLQHHLQKYLDEEQALADAKVLKHGPQGTIELADGVIKGIDGMSVSQSEDGTFYIDCSHPKAQPYDGYSTADYIVHVVKAWGRLCEAQAKLNKAESIKNGTRWDQVSNGLRQGTNAPIPAMPSECINYKKPVIVEKAK